MKKLKTAAQIVAGKKSKRKPIKSIVIAVDFDGTCVKHDYPRTGADIGAVPHLKALTDAGHRLILFTMRSGDGLQRAVEWFSGNNIPLWGINTNPTQTTWTESPKAHAHLYIDDRGLGVPLEIDPDTGLAHVDWSKVSTLIQHLLPIS